MTRRALCLLLLAYSSTAIAQAPPDWVAVDSFELLSPPSAWRYTDLDLRDPHVFLTVGTPPLAFCFDFTDNPIPTTQISFNGQIQTGFTTDGNGDGFLDNSNLLLFRPLNQLGAIGRVDSAAGQCTAPVAGTSCALPAGVEGNAFNYAAEASISCLAPIAGTTGSPAYSPAIASALPPCFRTAQRTFTVDNGGVPITLIDASIAATFQGNPASGLINGLLRGFLRESDANTILIPIPNTTPPQTIALSALLPGGTGNCSSRNDKDSLNGESGWWFYFNFSAQPVTYTGP